MTQSYSSGFISPVFSFQHLLYETVLAVLPPLFALLFILFVLMLLLPLVACVIASCGVLVSSLYSGKISVASFFSTFHPFTAVQHPCSSRSAELETRSATDTCMLLRGDREEGEPKGARGGGRRGRRRRQKEGERETEILSGRGALGI